MAYKDTTLKTLGGTNMTKVAPLTKRKPILTFVRLLCALLLVAVAISPAQSTPAFAGEVCTNADLQGAYLYSVAEQIGPVAILGKITADGRGNFAGTFSVSITGVIITDAPLTGTYSIAADCTGSWTTVYPAETHHFTLVLVDGIDGRKHAELLSTDAGTVATGAVKPMFNENEQ